jgi:hypothetical protein
MFEGDEGMAGFEGMFEGDEGGAGFEGDAGDGEGMAGCEGMVEGDAGMAGVEGDAVDGEGMFGVEGDEQGAGGYGEDQWWCKKCQENVDVEYSSVENAAACVHCGRVLECLQQY